MPCSSAARLQPADRAVSVILDDPMGNSYIQNPYAPDAVRRHLFPTAADIAQDPKMQEDTYERTFEQNEELGLNDIKVRPAVLVLGQR